VAGFAGHATSIAERLPAEKAYDPFRVLRRAVQYFDGVQWVPREEIPGAIDAGIEAAPDEWPRMNGVKRFYRFMDPSLAATKSFAIHVNRPRRKLGGGTIGLITHSHTQGDVDDSGGPAAARGTRHRRLRPAR
jgi:hypothetical protein